MDTTNVLLQLQMLAGMESGEMNALVPLASSALRSLESRLIPAQHTETELQRLEYAAACMAFYDLTCREAARRRLLTNQFGNADTTQDLTARKKAAWDLRCSALEGIREFIKPGVFLFAAADDLAREEES